MASTFPELLAAERSARGLSQEVLADRVTQAGCKATGATIGHWETGRRRPRPEGFRALATAIGWTREERDRAWVLLGEFDAQDDASDDDLLAERNGATPSAGEAA